MTSSKGVPKDEKPTAALQITVADDEGRIKKPSRCSPVALLVGAASLLVMFTASAATLTYFLTQNRRSPAEAHHARIAGFSHPRFSPFLGEAGLSRPAYVSADGHTVAQNLSVPGPNGRNLTLQYHAELIDDAFNRMLMLDHDPAVSAVSCATGHIRVNFSSVDLAVEFLQRASINGSFVTGGAGWNCTASALDNTPPTPGEQSAIILRTVTTMYVGTSMMLTGRRLSADSTGFAIAHLINSTEALAHLIDTLRATGRTDITLGTARTEVSAAPHYNCPALPFSSLRPPPPFPPSPFPYPLHDSCTSSLQYHHLLKHAKLSFHTNHYPRDHFVHKHHYNASSPPSTAVQPSRPASRRRLCSWWNVECDAVSAVTNTYHAAVAGVETVGEGAADVVGAAVAVGSAVVTGAKDAAGFAFTGAASGRSEHDFDGPKTSNPSISWNNNSGTGAIVRSLYIIYIPSPSHLSHT